MAEVTNATLGSLSGKAGTVVAANWRNIVYLRVTGRNAQMLLQKSRKKCV